MYNISIVNYIINLKLNYNNIKKNCKFNYKIINFYTFLIKYIRFYNLLSNKFF